MLMFVPLRFPVHLPVNRLSSDDQIWINTISVQTGFPANSFQFPFRCKTGSYAILKQTYFLLTVIIGKSLYCQ